MGRFVANGLGSLANSRKHSSFSLENLTRVIRNSVIHNDELARGPPVSALVFFHVAGQVVKNIPRKRGVVTEHNRLFRVISTVDPASVRRNNLIKEGLVAV